MVGKVQISSFIRHWENVKQVKRYLLFSLSLRNENVSFLSRESIVQNKFSFF